MEHVNEHYPRGEADTEFPASQSSPSIEESLDTAHATQEAGSSLLVTSIKQSNAPIESLPPELRYQLLALLDLRGLQTLIQASPVYLQQYHSARKLLLYSLLKSLLGSVVFEACAAFRLAAERDSGQLTIESAREHLERYEQCRSSGGVFMLLEEYVTEGDLASMIRFHHVVVAPLTQHFLHSGQHLLARCTEEHKEQEELSILEACVNKLSQDKLERLQRALYRFQCCCCLFGAGCLGPPGVNGHPDELFTPFLQAFEPWCDVDIERVACFLRNEYSRKFQAIHCEVDPMDLFQNYPHHLQESRLRIAYDIMISQGLELPSSVVNIDDEDQLYETMKEHLCSTEKYIFLRHSPAWKFFYISDQPLF